MTVIDGEFCRRLGAVEYTEPGDVSVVTLEWSEIIGTCNDLDTAVIDIDISLAEFITN